MLAILHIKHMVFYAERVRAPLSLVSNVYRAYVSIIDSHLRNLIGLVVYAHAFALVMIFWKTCETNTT